MNQAALENSILLNQFQAFYREVLRERERIEAVGQRPFRSAAGSFHDGADEQSGNGPDPQAATARGGTAAAVSESDVVEGPEMVPSVDSETESNGNNAPAIRSEPATDTAEAGGDSGDGGSDGTAGAGRDVAYPIHMRLLNLLERQTHESRRYGGEYGVTFYKEAQYVMAALADEVFLKLSWEGRESWKANLLEFKLFGTRVAGDRFYRNMDALLKNRDPAMVEMAAVYLLAISLGFRGKFRGIDDEGQLAYYRNQLFTFMYRRNPDLENEARRLFPEAYDYTLGSSDMQTLPHVKTWIIVIIILILLWLVISHGLWRNATDALIAVVETIFRVVGTP